MWFAKLGDRILGEGTTSKRKKLKQQKIHCQSSLIFLTAIFRLKHKPVGTQTRIGKHLTNLKSVMGDDNMFQPVGLFPVTEVVVPPSSYFHGIHFDGSNFVQQP